MENSRIYPVIKEHIPHAHKMETPQPLVSSLRNSAKQIGDFMATGKVFEDRLVDFRHKIFGFMIHYNLEFLDFKSDMEDKKFSKGGFGKRAVQKHPSLGVSGLRLVRDELSDGVFLKKNKTDLYRELLAKKILEETIELTECKSRKERKEELGDVFEVFNAFLDEMGINKRLLEKRVASERIEIAKRRRLARSKK